ncbi:type II toxin-antitoxin system HicA family toxin [Candidatus Nitrosotenuis chungbukensis]|uniref:type II toxin-antitoxin system HicA family toxin n=1 Tax=Candidatus Nitrosotenuis chungbukensis TaxID=1353246 RepID=UPI0005B270C7|nr:type II toxin-antitoxin system HicA family toxin [Candidatus Nitrosotenuis chungbukensis]WKT57185.1 type II toxin-antitoxin system HicA family toxin [Candidatus Nitrosotenuis chungbukensis]
MSKLPVISASKLIKILSKLGYYTDHQTGSHIILRNNKAPFRRLTIPNHKEIARGTLNAIIEDADMTRDEFLSLL